MPRKKARTLTAVELEFMKVVWEKGEVTGEEVRRTLEAARRPLAESTVRTMLGILEKKGYLKRLPGARSYIYRPRIPFARAQKHILKDTLERVFEGSASMLISALIREKMVPQEELSRIKKIISEYEKGEKR